MLLILVVASGPAPRAVSICTRLTGTARCG